MQRHCLEKNYFLEVCAYFNHQVISVTFFLCRSSRRRIHWGWLWR